MQNKNSEFDLQVKAMMGAAEVPAPAGAWDAIVARLDAAAAPVSGAKAGAGFLFGAAKTHRVWGWAAASFAMAASLALGIFLFTRNSGPEESAYVAESIEVGAAPNLLADNTLQEVLSAETGKGQSVKSNKSSSCDLRHGAESKVKPVAEPEAEPVAESNRPAEVATEPTVEPEIVQPTADPFAQMAMEDALKAKKQRRSYSAYVDGSFTTNNAGSGTSAYGVSASAGYTQTGVTETSKSSYGLPLSVGAGVRFHLNDRLSIGTGIDYSLLTRTFKGDYVSASEQVSGDIRHTMQYLGVPVNLYVKLLDFQGFYLYSFAGAEAEYGITNKFTILESAKNTVVGDKCRGMQYSAAFGLGIEFKLSERIGLYVDPSARYYFDCRQPKSIRTEKPFLFMFDAGLRFNL